MAKDIDNRKWLYGELSKKAELGSYEEFDANIDKNLQWAYDQIKDDYDLGSFDDFTNAVSKPKGTPYADIMVQAVRDYEANKPVLSPMVKPAVEEETGIEQMYPELSVRKQDFDSGYQSATGEQRDYRPLQKPEIKQNVEDEEYRLNALKPELTSEDEVTDYYADRYSKTKEGKKAMSELNAKNEEVLQKYMEEFSRSIPKGVSEEDATRMFAEKYSDKIKSEMQPYFDSYNEKIMSRYGYNIKEDINSITRKKIGETVDSLSERVNTLSEQAKKRPSENEPPTSYDRESLMRWYAKNKNTNLPDYKNLMAAKNLLDEAGKIKAESEKSGSTNFISSFGRGLRDSLFDADTWAMGLREMGYEKSIFDAVNKYERGEELTESEQILLDSAAANMATKAFMRSRLSSGYKAGEITGISLPFMLEMAVNPVSGAGRALAKGVLKYGLKRFAGSAARKAITSNASKFTARALGDIAAASGMTATTGLGQTIAGTLERMAGDVQFDKDFKFSGVKNREKAFDAFAKEFATNTVERQSEMVFYAIGGAGNLFKPFGVVAKEMAEPLFKPVSSALGKMSNSQIFQIVSSARKNPYYKAVSEQVKYGGLGEEYLEEVYNNMVNVALGEMDMNDATSFETNKDLLLGLAPTSLFMSTLGAGGQLYSAYKAKKAQQSASDYMNERMASISDDLRKAVMDNDIKRQEDFILAIMRDRKTSDSQKKNMLSYLNAVRIEALNSMPLSDEDVAERKQDIEQSYFDARNNLLKYMPEEEFDLYQIGQNEEVDDAYMRYLSAKDMMSQVERMIENKANEAAEQAVSDTDEISNKDTNQVVRVNMSGYDEPVYIVGGNISFLEDGKVDRQNSDEYVYYRDQEGKVRQVLTDEISGIVSLDDSQSFAQQAAQQAAEDVRADNVARETLLVNGTPFSVVDITPDGATLQMVDNEGNLVMSQGSVIQVPKEELDRIRIENAPAESVPTENIEESVNQQVNQDRNMQVTAEVQEESEQGVQKEEVVKPASYESLPIDDTINDIKSKGLDEEEVSSFVEANMRESEKSVASIEKKKPSIGTDIESYKSEKEVWQNERNEAQSRLDYWNKVKKRLSELKDESVAEIVDEPAPAVSESEETKRWINGKKTGSNDTYILPNGEELSGVYVLVEAEDVLPSHNPFNGYSKTEGFPTDENGNTVNSRDYENNPEYRKGVEEKAKSYDMRAVQDPVIVSKDGFVMSGNDRTMSGQIAAKNGTDSKYVEYISSNASKYGFTSEDIALMKHPRIVFVPDTEFEYTAKEFDKFNKDSKKTESKTEQTVKLGKIVSEKAVNQIASIIDEKETMTELYSDKKAIDEIVNILVSDGVLNPNEKDMIYDGDQLSAYGKDFVENVLVGSVLSEESVRKINQMKDVRQRVVKSILLIVQNGKLGDYSLTQELSDAISYLYDARKNGYKDGIAEYIRQTNMFGENPSDIYSSMCVLLAEAIDTTERKLKKMLSLYNSQASDAAGGQFDMFSGDVKSKDQIVNDVVNYILGRNENRTEQEQGTDSAVESADVATGGNAVGVEETETQEQVEEPSVEQESTEQLLTEEEINSSTVDDILKTGALQYIRGQRTMPTELAYLNVYYNVRNRSRNTEPTGKSGDTAQLPETNDVNEPAGQRQGEGETVNVDRGRNQEDVPEKQDSGTDSTGVNAVSFGEQGDNVTSGEKAGTDRLSSGSGKSARSSSARSKRGNVRSTGRNRVRREDVKNYPERYSETIKDLNDAIDEMNRLLDEFEKAGDDYLSVSFVGMNPKQIEIAGRVFVTGVKIGYNCIKVGVYKFDGFLKRMREKLHDPFASVLKLTDADIDSFIGEMWEYNYTIDGKTMPLREWASILEKEELRKNVRSSIQDKLTAQRNAESVNVVLGDIENIRESLPFLLPQQQEDVRRAEVQFFDESHNDREHAFGKGYMFTNGTGTGKTYTGLGIVKRFVKQGKGRILILTPSQPKVTDWINDGKNLGLDIKALESTKDKGDGVVITTFANLRTNLSLMEDVFDLVVYDESHRIMENRDAVETIGARQHYMLTNKNESEAVRRIQSYHPLWTEYDELVKEMSSLNTMMADLDMTQEEYAEKDARREEIDKRLNELSELQEKAMPEITEQAKEAVKKTKVVFLSATPFNTIPSLAYAEGYIFSYPEENQATLGSYNHRSPREEFLERNFGAGYRFRYGRIENHVENADALSQQEIRFSDYLENELQTKSGRVIDSEYDYSRDFPTVTFNFASMFNGALEDVLYSMNNDFKPLREAFTAIFFDYNYSTALFETMKVSAIIPRIKQHLEMGRKVVIFHRRKSSKTPLSPPFSTAIEAAENLAKISDDGTQEGKKKKEQILDAIDKFEKKYSKLLEYEKTLNYSMPREQIADAFGRENVLYFSGSEGKKAKDEAVRLFNQDDSGKNIIVIQEASGKEGISLHDTTSNHQRVLITLALPQSPITALQIEGRIYRIGNKSNAIFEYPLLGLNLETTLFGSKFNQQVSTTENLALGSSARNLRKSFADGVIYNSGDIPLDSQGVGGKELDNSGKEDVDMFDRSVLDYYGTKKLKSGRSNREGVDFYPTPEPIGFKMVEWAELREGENVLEPSAGHGAIARYVPRENQLVAIEPSQQLFSELQLIAGSQGRKFVDDFFENYNIVNKFDAVLMNPPYGVAGATAMKHLDKAFSHLNEGGRVIAIIPRGSTDKKFESWVNSKKDAVFTGEVLLPSVTFERAGTSVSTRIVIVDKVTRDEAKKNVPMFKSVDLTYIEKIDDTDGLFEAIRDIQMPRRTIDQSAIDIKNARKTEKAFKDIKSISSVSYSDESIEVIGRGIYFSENYSELKNPSSYRWYYNELESLKNRANKSNSVLEKIEFYETLLKTYQNVSGKTHEQLMDAYNEKRALQEGTKIGVSSEAMYDYKEDVNTKTNDVMHLAVPKNAGSLSEEEYKEVSDIAKKNGGYWSRFKKTFHFQSKESADRFIEETANLERKNKIRYRIEEQEDVYPEEYREILESPVKRDPIYTMSNIMAETYPINKRSSELMSEARLIGVLEPGTANINLAKAARKRDLMVEALDLIKDDLLSVIPNSSKAARGYVMDMVYDIDSSIKYYNDLAEGKDVWRYEDPRYKEDRPSKSRVDESLESEGLANFDMEEINSMSKKLNTDVEIISTPDEIQDDTTRRMIERGVKIKGWYDPRTNKVYIYAPNATNTNDVRATILHEVIGHEGLRDAFGEAFDDFISSVFGNASKDIQQKIISLSAKYGYDVNLATEEYIASQAESGFESNTFFGKVREYFHRMLSAAKLRLGFRISDNEIRYMLWRTYQLKTKGRNMDSDIENMAKMYQMKAGRFDESPKNIRYRMDDALNDVVRQMYEKRLSTPMYKFSEAYFDYMESAKVFIDEVAKQTNEPIKDFENFYFAENQLSSVNQAQQELYEREYFDPMIKEVSKLIQEGETYQNVIDYVMAKHGLERNVRMAERKAEKAAEKKEKELFVYYRSIQESLNTGKISQSDYDSAKSKLDSQVDSARKAAFASARKRDFSGIKTFDTGSDRFEDGAKRIVSEFENAHNVSDLWSSINKATRYSLDRLLSSGELSKQHYDSIVSMYDYYVPLRGWSDESASDVYDYINAERPVTSNALKKAEGRTSKADDPFAYIGNIASTSIMQANSNEVKQKFMNFVINHPTTLATIKEQWYEMNPNTGDWYQSYPEISENETDADVIQNAIEEHEERMKELKKQGLAKKGKLEVPYIALPKEKRQHVVTVNRNGIKYNIFINGNPRLSQALNGLLKINKRSDVSNLIKKTNRFIASNCTSRNPEFVLRNLRRDFLFANAAGFIKEGPAYSAKLFKTMAYLASPVRITKDGVKTWKISELLYKYNNGSLDTNKEYEKYFKEFVENGGRTGYGMILSAKTYKRKIKERLRKEGEFKFSDSIGVLKDAIEFANNSAESLSRFAVYMTSRKEGRSVIRSINDAKEITVNFNRKGSGALGADALSSWFMFFNVGVQGTRNFFGMAKVNPIRWSAVVGSAFSAGILIPMLNNFIIGMLGYDGGDDPYMDLPEWVRKNNVNIYIGDGRFYSYTLPIEIRALYGMGDIAYSTISGDTRHRNIGAELFGQLSTFTPINPFGGVWNLPKNPSWGDVATNIAANLSPDAAKPIVQLWQNRDFFGSPIYRESSYNERMPEYTKAYAGTADFFVKITEDLNRASGGHEFKRGFINWNPASIEHLVESYFGGLGKFAIKTSKSVGMLFDKEEVALRSIPFANVYLSEIDDRNKGRKINEIYFNYVDEMKDVEQEIIGLKRNITKEGNMELYKGLADDKTIQKYYVFKSYNDAIKNIIDYKKEIEGSDTQTPEEVDRSILLLKASMIEEMDKIDDMYK